MSKDKKINEWYWCSGWRPWKWLQSCIQTIKNVYLRQSINKFMVKIFYNLKRVLSIFKPAFFIMIFMIIPNIVNAQHLIPLHLWWSPGRGDNFTTTDHRWIGSRGETRSPDYRWVGILGEVFDPADPQPPETVPLYSWYSPGRGDNFITSDERYRPRSATDRRRSPDYRFVRLEGYIYKNPFSGTVPLQSHWSPGRGDNFATTHYLWAGTIGKRTSPDYRLYRTEGYIVATRSTGETPYNRNVIRIDRAKAWVWANQPTTENYLGHPGYQYNSCGGTNKITRLGTGKYIVKFTGLGTSGGTVQVTSYRGNHQSKVVRWGKSGIDLNVTVYCFSPNGRSVDAMFTVLFYKEKRGSAWTDAYLWADGSVPPNRAYQWNSKGLINTVRHLSRGRYEVKLPGMNLLGGTVLVTAYGSGSERAKVERWNRTRDRNNTLAYVRCFDSGGNPIDTRFTLSFLMDVGLGIRYSEDQDYGGFVLADQPTTARYTPRYQYNNTGRTNTITKLSGDSSYRVHFPRLASSNRTTASATAYGSGSEYCTIDHWSSDGSGGTYVFVKCFNQQGNSVNTRFTLLYLTDEKILH
jgi:hypothetical protein